MNIKKLAAGTLASAAVVVALPATAQANAIGPFSNCAGRCESLGTFGPGWTQGVFWPTRTADRSD
ncbi:hypothetical protein SK803_18915 [Lentzea sp. BCCO 10_0856]|uniref:Uncharacterized protein n=1 Tax=Lentzea miocenica TaxID=3095431 RepID=A0ABU4T2B3_9PSEU|nr:hypothetical protein [Lentzea sp. BCCO 10_0856]MDX8032293.1 hypothetical protein [Lentzea sp. BCCO 10_0856]